MAHTTSHAGGGLAVSSGKRLQKELAQKLFVFVLEGRLHHGLQLQHHDEGLAEQWSTVGWREWSRSHAEGHAVSSINPRTSVALILVVESLQTVLFWA